MSEHTSRQGGRIRNTLRRATSARGVVVIVAVGIFMAGLVPAGLAAGQRAVDDRSLPFIDEESEPVLSDTELRELAAEEASQATQSFSEEAIERVMANTGADREGSIEILTIQQRLNEVDTMVQDTYPEAYLNGSIDPTNGKRLTIRVNAAGAVDQILTLVDAAGLTDRVDIVVEDGIPFAELIALLQNQVEPSLDEVLAPVDPGQLSSGIDQSNNRIRIRVERNLDAARSAVETRWPELPIALEVFEYLPEPLACNSRTDCNPFRGGILIDGANDSFASCTSGFSAINANGADYVLTAGHCLNAGTIVHNGVPARRVGGVAFATNGGNVDVARIFVDRSYAVDDFFTAQGANNRDVSSAMNTYGTTIGQTICHTGYRSAVQPGVSSNDMCGEVEDEHDGYGGGSSGMLRFSACSQAGDSGASTYTFNTAIGLLAGGERTSACSSLHDTWVGWINAQLNAAGVDLMCAPPGVSPRAC